MVTPAPRIFIREDPVLQRTILGTLIGTDLVYDTLANRTVYSPEEKDIVSMERYAYQGESACASRSPRPGTCGTSSSPGTGPGS